MPKEKKEKEERLMLLTVLLVCIFIPGLLHGILSHDNYRISMPESANYYRDKDYKIVVDKLEDLGFRNIDLIEKTDLENEDESKLDKVYSIIINGQTNFSSGDEFDKNDRVVITYYSLEE